MERIKSQRASVDARDLIAGIGRDIRVRWKSLASTAMLYNLITVVLLTPVVAFLFRGLIAISGNTVLTDQDIVFFFIGPVGVFCLIIVGALSLAIKALEQTALIGILATAAQPSAGFMGGIRFASVNAWRVTQVAARLVGLALLTAAPFLAVAATVYYTLLTEYDINYYLQERPPVFLVAVSIGGFTIVALLVVLLRLSTGWFFALPLVLFEDVDPSEVLRLSRQRADGHRWALLLWIAGWFLATSAVSVLATTVVFWLGTLVVPQAIGSLGLLTFVIGLSLIIWAGIGFALTLLSTMTLAAMLIGLYRHLGGGGVIDLPRRNRAGSTGDRTGFQLTRARVLAAVILGIVVATVVGVITLQSLHLEDDVEIIAHRGSSFAAPENTMAAVQLAIDDGADWVEIDVQETADGNVVVFHDSDFMKLAGVDLKIWNATVDDLRDIDIGSWFSAEFSAQRVPTLGNVLEACQGRVGVNIELKYYGHDERLEQRVVDIVEAHDMAGSVVIMSLKTEAVEKMRSLRPHWKIGLLMSVSAGDLQRIDVDFFAVNAAFANRRFIRSVHGDGQEVYVWTVNDAVTMSTMIGRGVDGLITDKPNLARSVLQQRAQMSPPERLLTELAGFFGVEGELGEQ